MKHLLFLIMILATLALSGCGNSDPASGTSNSPIQLSKPAI